MSRYSEQCEDEAFASLDKGEEQRYFANLKETGDPSRALDATIGTVWFDRDGAPNGHRYRGRGGNNGRGQHR